MLKIQFFFVWFDLKKCELIVIMVEIEVLDNKALYLKQLYAFFRSDTEETNDNMAQILPLLNGHDSISLRTIEWFVVNYSKHYNISYRAVRRTGIEMFNVHSSYELKLKSLKKAFFDPCCRKSRIIFPYNTNDRIMTTIAQLNFFKWFVENNLLEYIKDNLNEIKADQKDRARRSETSTTEKRRSRLSENSLTKSYFSNKEISISM